MVGIGFPVVWLYARIRQRRRLRAGRKRWQQHWPTIRARYLAVIDERYEQREAVIAELAQALELSSHTIQAELARHGIYKARAE